jgi:hypothetical protein
MKILQGEGVKGGVASLPHFTRGGSARSPPGEQLPAPCLPDAAHCAGCGPALS